MNVVLNSFFVTLLVIIVNFYVRWSQRERFGSGSKTKATDFVGPDLNATTTSLACSKRNRNNTVLKTARIKERGWRGSNREWWKRWRTTEWSAIKYSCSFKRGETQQQHLLEKTIHTHVRAHIPTHTFALLKQFQFGGDGGGLRRPDRRSTFEEEKEK